MNVKSLPVKEVVQCAFRGLAYTPERAFSHKLIRNRDLPAASRKLRYFYVVMSGIWIALVDAKDAKALLGKRGTNLEHLLLGFDLNCSP